MTLGKNLVGILGVLFGAVSALVQVVRWVDSLDRRLALVEQEQEYYHGQPLVPGPGKK